MFYLFFLNNLFPCSIEVVYFSLHKGETSIAHKIHQAGKNLNFDMTLVELRQLKFQPKKRFDFVISMAPHDSINEIDINYLYVPGPHEERWIDLKAKDPKERKLLPSIERFDALLITPYDQEFEQIPLIYQLQKPTLDFYSTSLDFGYEKVECRTVFWMPASWGNRRYDKKFIELNTKLDTCEWIKTYGSKEFKKIYPQTYQYPISFESGTLEKEIQNNGICLVIHGEEHFQMGLPTARIFEAFSAGAILICDKNRFVEKYFSDCVFFIDTTHSSDEIFFQIQTHYEYIMTHQEEALKKAKKGYQIFKEQFTMEKQLLDLLEFHNQIFGL